MAKAVLHIGTHKTGTTALQNWCWKQSRVLAARGCIYPRLAYRHTGHHGLVTDWGTHLPSTYLLKGGSRAALTDIAERYAHRSGVVLLSSEELSRADEGQRIDLQEIKSLLGAFEEVSVVCVLRPQWQLLQSLYAEVSRRRSPTRPPEIVAKAIATQRAEGLFLNYHDLFSWLRSAFETKDIHLLDYASARTSVGGTTGAIMKTVGVTMSEELARQACETANRSPWPLVQWMANLMSEPALSSPALLQWLNGQYQGHPRQCLFTRAELHQLRQAFSPSNAELTKVSGLTLSDPDLPEDTLYREDVQLEFWKNVARNLRAAANL